MTQTRDVISIPELCLVVLIGSSGSGKSTFAARHFKPSEVVSSDHYREVVSDDANDLTVSAEAFDAVHHIAGLRLGLERLTVIDATSVKPQDRAPLVRIAREHDVFPIAIVLDVDEQTCQKRNAARPDRQFGPHVVRNHVRLLRQSLRGLEREGFRQVAILRSPEAIEAIRIERTPLWSNRKTETGPFDIIGDVHGCRDELEELLDQLGYLPDAEAGWRHPGRRKAIFLGDLVDRGLDVIGVVNLVRRMVEADVAYCVPGNHDIKLQRALGGANVQISHGLADSLAQIEALPPEERAAWREGYVSFVDSLVSHLALDGGRLVVAHAGMKAEYQGRTSGRVRSFALYGETTGETDEFGLPVRYPWAGDYRGDAMVLYGFPTRDERDTFEALITKIEAEASDADFTKATADAA
jgi:protein phosphatase